MTYEIWAKCKGQNWEIIEENIHDKMELDYLLNEYRLAYGEGWIFRVKMIKGVKH